MRDDKIVKKVLTDLVDRRWDELVEEREEMLIRQEKEWQELCIRIKKEKAVKKAKQEAEDAKLMEGKI